VSEEHGVERDLCAEPESPPDDELVALAECLLRSRPQPAPWFRGALRRSVARGRRRIEHRRVRALLIGYSASGAVLLLIAALSASGNGPM
jgi:hypothetical protein